MRVNVTVNEETWYFVILQELIIWQYLKVTSSRQKPDNDVKYHNYSNHPESISSIETSHIIIGSISVQCQWDESSAFSLGIGHLNGRGISRYLKKYGLFPHSGGRKLFDSL